MNNLAPKITYGKPPLTEVVFGVQFNSIQDFVVGHIGELWNEYKSEYPVCREQPALVSPIEQMPGETISMQIIQSLMPRAVFAKNDNSSVIQVQRDAFYYNWQRPNVDIEYPRYERTSELFLERFRTFVDFISNNNLQSVKPVQFELTYLNEIPLDTNGIEVLKDANWKASSHSFLQAPETINLSASFLLSNSTGRLHSSFRNIVKPNGEHVYHWMLVVRGATNPRSDMSIDKAVPWFDNARDWIVQSFADMATPEAQDQLWERLS